MERTFEIGELLADAGWLRQLAASLVGPARADDLVQDTWLAALRRPPRADGAGRPWLARVVRNLARNERRGHARREARESLAHVERVDAGPEELVQAAEAQRLLAESVTRLAEPLRVVIVLCYFQGLDSSVAAARLGLASSTVRTRVQTALAELRADLDRRTHGGRREWALLLAPLASGTRAAQPAPAAALGSWSSALIACAVAGGLVTVAALTWNGARSADADMEAELHAAAAMEPTSRTDASTDGLNEASAAPGGRTGAADAGSAPAPLEPSEALRVSGTVLVDARPPEWPIELTLEPTLPSDPPKRDEMRPRQPRPVLTLAPEQRGEFRFPPLPAAWRGRLLVEGFQLASGGSSLAIEGPSTGLVLELVSAPDIVGRVLGPDGLPIPGLAGICALAIGERGEPAKESGTRHFACRDDGRFRIPSKPWDGWGSFRLVFESESGHLLHETPDFVPARGLDLGELTLERTRALEFTVRDAHGAPLAGAFACVESDISVRTSEPSTADGHGVLAWCTERTTTVCFRAFAHADRVLAVDPTEPCEVALEPLAVLTLDVGSSVAASAQRVWLSAESPAFVWDPDGWDGDYVFQSDGGAARSVSRRRPAVAGQRFEYEFPLEGSALVLVGLMPHLALTLEARDSDGRALAVDTISLEPGARTALVLGAGEAARAGSNTRTQRKREQ